MINYYVLECRGKDLKRFIKNLLKLNIDILDIKYFHDYIVIAIKYDDYKKIKDIKTTYSIKIVGVHGIKKIKSLIHKYQIFLLFFIFSGFLIIFLAKIIFFINIDCKNPLVKDAVNDYFIKDKITPFSISKNFNYYENLAQKIKEDNPNLIEWIEIKHDGVYLNVNIIERKEVDNLTEDDKITNIVASKNGVIRDIYSTSGQIIKFKDDYVNKGDIIVSGIIKRNDKVVGSTKSKALVYAEVWYKVTLSKPYNYIDKKDSDICYVNYKFNMLGYDLNLLKFKSKKCKKEGTIYHGSMLKVNRNVEKIAKDVTKKYTKEDLEKSF